MPGHVGYRDGAVKTKAVSYIFILFGGDANKMHMLVISAGQGDVMGPGQCCSVTFRESSKEVIFEQGLK